MARGLTIGPIGSPYTLTANPVGFNYLMYSRALQQTGPGQVFTLGAGALSFGYTLQPVGINPPISLALSPNAFAYTLQSNTLTLVTTPPPLVSGGYYKFNPGRCVSSEMDENTVPFAQVQTEVNTWAANPTGFVGYRYTLCWRDLEDFTQAKNLNNPAAIATQYPGVLLHQAAFYYLMAKSAGTAQYRMYVNFDIISPSSYTSAVITGTNWLTTTTKASVPRWVINCTGISGTSTPGTLTVPDFYGATTTSIYSGSVAPMYSGSPYYGIAFCAYDGTSAFSRLLPKFWEPPVNQAKKQAIQALAQFQFTAGAAWSSATAYTVGTPVTSGGQNWLCKVANTNSLPASGNTNWMANTWVGQTLNSAKNVERTGTNDEYAYTMIAGASDNISGCPYQNPPFSNGISAIAPTSANAFIGLTNFSEAWAAATPNTVVDTCMSFGFDGTGTFDSNTNMPGYWNNLISGTGLSAIQGLALGNSNWYAVDYASGANAAIANAFQQGHIGISPAAGGTGSLFTLPTPTFTSLVPLAPLSIQHQPEDYYHSLPAGTSGSTAAAVTALLAPSAKVLATHEDWNITTSQSGSPFQFSPTFYTSIIQPTLSGVALSSVLIQKNLMLAAQSVAVVATSTTTATVTWAPDTNAANTSHGWTVFVNGTPQAGSPTTASASSYTLTGLTAGTPYTIGVAMSNANGTGPAGTFAYTSPLFFFPNFSGSPNIHLGAGGGAVSGGTINFPNVSHAGGGVWYGAGVENIQAFTTDFTFVIPSAGNYGLVFSVQNSNATTNPFGNFGINAGGFSANGLGWGAGGGSGQPACANSVGLVFGTNGMNSAFGLPSPLSEVGLYVDGGPGIGGGGLGPANGFSAITDLHNLGPNLGNGNLMHCFLTYDGTILTMVLTDTVALVSTRQSWPVNIPACVGANTAFIGFCQSQPSTGSGQVTVNSWNWTGSAGTRLATPTFSVAAGQYTGAQSVALSGPAGASIRYTTNGTPPTSLSTLYSGTPITVSTSQVIQAVAIQTGFTDSVVAQALYRIQSGSLTVNFPSGFASNGGLVQFVGNSHLSGSNIVLTDATNTGESGAAWFDVPVPISGSWSTTFAMTMTGDGLCFVIQGFPQTNTGTNLNWGIANGPYGVVTVSGGPWSLSAPNVNGASNLGYTNIFASVAIAFTSAGVGQYQNNGGNGVAGVVPSGSQVSCAPVSLESGAAVTVTLAYNGTALTITLTQGANTFGPHTFPNVNIPLIVGGGVTPATSGYVGFTAGTAQFGSATLQITSWTM